MKKILFGLAVLAIFSCDSNPIVGYSKDKKERFRAIEYEGCEYIYVANDSRTLTHKGSCKNPIHVYRGDTLYPVSITIDQ